MTWTHKKPPSQARDVIGGVTLVTQHGIAVTAVKGNLVDQRVDVIVNTSSADLELGKSGVSQAILNAAGQGIQDECRKIAPNGVQHGEIAVTDGYNLHCQKVYHGSLPSWKTSDALTCMRKFVAKCLDSAHSDSFCSIAFPAIGTGQLGYPHDQVASAVYQEIHSFSKNNPRTSLQDIRFVIYSKDSTTEKAFIDEIQNLSGNAGSSSKGVYWTTVKPYVLKTVEGITVSSINGDITEKQVDVIVNSTTRQLSITSGRGVSAAITKAAGSDIIEQECKKVCPDGIDYGDICKTSGGNLRCTYIYHGAVPQWTDSKAKQCLEAFVDKCLKRADADGVTSIAFPAIGTGEQKYPTDVVAKVLYERTRRFSENNSGTSLTNITFVIFEKDQSTLKAFGVEISRLSGKTPPSTVTPKHPRSARVVSVVPHKLQMLVVQGDITQETTDAIVNSTTENMSLDSEVSQAILKAAGQPFKDDVQQLAKNKIQEVAVSTGGNMQCKHVIHVVVPRKDQSGNLEKQQWNRAVSMCLTKAEALGLQSVSIPALGTGKMGGDTNMMANILIDAIFAYKRSRTVNTLKIIRVVIFNSQDLQCYQAALLQAQAGKPPISDGIRSGLPTNWTPTPGRPVASISLSSTDSEFQSVAKNFANSLGSIKRQIVKIERIQNSRTYLAYQNEKKHIESQNGPGCKNERRLWHGTAKDAINDINSTNFNRSYCGKNATMYGEGVYFALSASYSDNDKYSVPDSQGYKYMYQCLVLTGKYTTGDSTMKVPPKRDPHLNIQFDSVVNNQNNPSIFVVFYDTKAYPEFLITYKK